MLRRACATATCLLFCAAVAAAQTTPAAAAPDVRYPTFSFGTITYLQYDAELRDRADFNAFDLTRAYLQFNSDLSPRIAFRVTPDIRRATAGSVDGSLVFRLKFGYLDIHNARRDAWLRAGLHQTPWLDFEESVNRYRVEGQMFAEREGLIPGSSDFGMGGLKRFAENRLEMQGGIYNGEGYGHPEADRGKSAQLRVTAVPFRAVRGLRLSIFGDREFAAVSRSRHLAIAMASFESERAVATVEALQSTYPTGPTSVGGSAFLEIRRHRTGPAGFARLERLTTRNNESHSRQRTIAGGAYWVLWAAIRLGFVMSLEDVRSTLVTTTPHERRLLAQSHIQF